MAEDAIPMIGWAIFFLVVAGGLGAIVGLAARVVVDWWTRRRQRRQAEAAEDEARNRRSSRFDRDIARMLVDPVYRGSSISPPGQRLRFPRPPRPVVRVEKIEPPMTFFHLGHDRRPSGWLERRFVIHDASSLSEAMAQLPVPKPGATERIGRHLWRLLDARVEAVARDRILGAADYELVTCMHCGCARVDRFCARCGREQMIDTREQDELADAIVKGILRSYGVHE